MSADINYWLYRARPLRAVDGDTIEVVVDLGMYVHSTQHLRIKDIDTPEIFRGSDEEKAAGQEAKQYTWGWLEAAVAFDPDDEWPLEINTHKDRQSFNRYVADVYRKSDGADLAQSLVDAGHAEWVG